MAIVKYTIQVLLSEKGFHVYSELCVLTLVDGNIMTSSDVNIFYITGPLYGNWPVTGEFLSQSPAMRSFDVFFDLCLNKRLSKQLRHWWFEMHICISKSTIIGSDNGLSPHQCQAIIWTNARILLIGPLETTFSEILMEISKFSIKKIHLKLSSVKLCSYSLDLNVLKTTSVFAVLFLTKFPTFGRQHFQMHFLDRNVVFWSKFYWILFVGVQLVQIMAWHQKQATSHYLKQWWPSV